MQRVIDHIGVSPVSHDGKALIHVLESYPRDELFQSSVPELRAQRARHRQPVRATARAPVRCGATRTSGSSRCLLYVPRDRYNTQARERIEQHPARGTGRR